MRFAEKYRGFHEGDYNNEHNVLWEKNFHKKVVVQLEKPFFINPQFHLNQKGNGKCQEPFDIYEIDTPFNGKICSDFVVQDGLAKSDRMINFQEGECSHSVKNDKKITDSSQRATFKPKFVSSNGKGLQKNINVKKI